MKKSIRQVQGVGKVVEYDSTNKILYYIQTRFNDEGVDSNGNLTAFLVVQMQLQVRIQVQVVHQIHQHKLLIILYSLVDIILVK